MRLRCTTALELAGREPDQGFLIRDGRTLARFADALDGAIDDVVERLHWEGKRLAEPVFPAMAGRDDGGEVWFRFILIEVEARR